MIRYEELENYKDYTIVPLSKSILSDFITPIEALRKLKKIDNHVFLLESVHRQEFVGRFSFLGFDPKMEITCKDGEVCIKDKEGNITKQNNPCKVLDNILKQYKSKRFDDMPPFTGGLVGYFAYDFVKYSDNKCVINSKDEENFKDMDLMLFDKIIAFDNVSQKIEIIVNVERDCSIDAYNTAVREIEKIENILKHADKDEYICGKIRGDINALFDKEKYCAMVKKAKKHIYEGDIFQVVLSNRLSADYRGSILNVYRILRTTNPSPYMFYFGSDDMEMSGASPETLVKLDNGTLYTFPLAGTRRRGKTKEEDITLERELLADEKERAEHNMLVDLGRNDLGKICKFGSVEVEKYMDILRFSHVMHIGSTVKGTIKDEYSPVDAIKSVLPAGTLSGAPKKRAMEIIDELEDNKRGVYGGAIGYIDFAGNMDMCIAIRLVFKKNNKIFIRSGAGIVADSIPENEYNECIQKAKAVVEAVNIAENI